VPPTVEFLPRLTASEKKIVAALDSKTDLDFDNQPLADVIDYIKAKHEIEIQLDQKALEEAGVDNQTPVTRSVKGISLRSTLHLMLDQLDLTYMLADEVMLVTTKEKAEGTIFIRTYPVKDLVAPPADGDDRLVKTIIGIVDPDLWEDGGGPGSIAFVPASGSLVISQTYGVHEKVLNLLQNLRAARSENGKESDGPHSSFPRERR
jgi:hypothetical protein